MHIISVTPNEVGLVAPLFDQYRVFYRQPSDPALAQAFIAERVANRESVIFLALQDGEPVGFTQLYPSFSSVSARRTWILNDLYVVPSCRGQGVGSALLERARAMRRRPAPRASVCRRQWTTSTPSGCTRRWVIGGRRGSTAIFLPCKPARLRGQSATPPPPRACGRTA